MDSAQGFYDAFGEDYDRFVNWGARLSFELPLLLRLLQRHGAHSVLDVAAGTGQHAIALAKAGYTVGAADISGAMVEQAQRNVNATGLRVDLRQAGFGDLQRAFDRPFDAVLCLGNSYSHLTELTDLERALRDMRGVLRDGGLLVLQSRNLERILAERDRFMPPQTHTGDNEEWLFVRFYDFFGDLLRFNLVRLCRRGDNPWVSRVDHTWLRAWTRAQLLPALGDAGFGQVEALGSLAGEPYEATESSDLVLLARASTIA